MGSTSTVVLGFDRFMPGVIVAARTSELGIRLIRDGPTRSGIGFGSDEPGEGARCYKGSLRRGDVPVCATESLVVQTVAAAMQVRVSLMR